MRHPLLADARIALVQDWFPTYGGAERVTEQILRVFPQADVFGLIESLPADQRAFLGGRRVATSFVQRLPFGPTRYRWYLPLMPLAVEQFDLSGYDLVISSSNAFAKGVITGPDQLHVAYLHSPMRFAWDLQHQYLRETPWARGPLGWLLRHQLHRLRNWDARTAHGVDAMIANSSFVARRIRKAYGREAEVIHPPVDTDAFTLRRRKDDFYLTASRLVPYKRVELIVDAFAAMPERRLVVIGDGPEGARIRARATANVTVMGYQPFEVLRDHMQRARAFVFAAEEDFGIAPVEAQACGTPVIAFGRGGVRDSVRDLDRANPTGVFFETQTASSLAAAVRRFEAERERFAPEEIRRWATRFGVERFRRELAAHVEARWLAFHHAPPAPPPGEPFPSELSPREPSPRTTAPDPLRPAAPARPPLQGALARSRS